jgi:ribosomal protein S18 acetylase RimI-like enzyme
MNFMKRNKQVLRISMAILSNKSDIERFLRRNAALHLYELGDLDDFFFPYTTWYGHESNGQIDSIVLMYKGTELPVLLALSDEPAGGIKELLREISGELPDKFYCHLSPGLEKVFTGSFKLEPHGQHLKMALSDPKMLEKADTSGVVPLSVSDEKEILDFYASAYPGNWFDARMLETGQYFGLRRNGRLVSIAGIHVYSPEYRVAALGNIATLPELRGQGLGTKVSAALCQNLLKTVDVIGLNVLADNAGAIKCYRKLGFEDCGEYGEFMAYRN